MDPSRDELIAQVCHELRAPLTPIKGYLHTLLRRDEELGPEERRHIYEVLLREEQRMEDLVRDLLHATTLDHQEPAAATDAVDWPTLVAEQVDLYRQSDLSREITAEVAPEVGTVIADAGLATSVLANLLTNALKHSPAGTPIAVRASLDGRLGGDDGERPGAWRPRRGPRSDLRSVRPGPRERGTGRIRRGSRPVPRAPGGRGDGRRDLVR